jgi:hypothetical protein
MSIPWPRMQLSAATNAAAPPAAVVVELELLEPQAASAAQSAPTTHGRVMRLTAAVAVMV